ncbi:hypothetical protein [Natronorarus salvus]|uniref:hypothetical protein n=1 Tax=Natronorarus salvus TaxID=3117733 RepID=UPI002F26CF6A
MEIREPESPTELHAAPSLTADAWREAFSPIVNEEAFEAVELLPIPTISTIAISASAGWTTASPWSPTTTERSSGGRR